LEGRADPIIITERDGARRAVTSEHPCDLRLRPRRDDRNQFVFYPTGAGEPRRLDIRPDQFNFMSWFPDSATVMVCGSASASPPRCYRQPIAGGAMTPIGPLSAVGGSVRPDGSHVLTDGGEKDWLYPASGGEPTVLDARKLKEATFVGWSADGQPFFTTRGPAMSKDLVLAPNCAR
jgi:hypothetical protein